MILNVFCACETSKSMSKSYNYHCVVCFQSSQVVFLKFLFICLNLLLTEVEPVSEQLLAPQKIKKIFLIIYSYTKILKRFGSWPRGFKSNFLNLLFLLLLVGI